MVVGSRELGMELALVLLFGLRNMLTVDSAVTLGYYCGHRSKTGAKRLCATNSASFCKLGVT